MLSLHFCRCKHAFHKSCIRPWLMERQGCCPLCKTNVLSDELAINVNNSIVDDEGDANTQGPPPPRWRVMATEAWMNDAIDILTTPWELSLRSRTNRNFWCHSCSVSTMICWQYVDSTICEILLLTLSLYYIVCDLRRDYLHFGWVVVSCSRCTICDVTHNHPTLSHSLIMASAICRPHMS